MTPFQSNARLGLYVGLAVLTSIQSDFQAIKAIMEQGKAFPWWDMVDFGLKALIAGAIVWRSYIDKTPSQVEKEP